MSASDFPPAPEQVPPIPAGSVPPPEESQQLRFPEDIRTRWGWKDILIFVVASLGFYFAFGLIVVVGFVAAGHPMQELQNSDHEKALFAVITTAIVSIAQLLFFYLYLSRAQGQGFWQTIGWRSLRAGGRRMPLGPAGFVAGGCIFALAIGFASKFAGEPHGAPIEMFMHDRLSAALFLILGVSVAPLVEETIFRGFLYPVAARSFGVAGSVIFTGLIFGLLHGPQLGGAWIQTGLLVLVGIVFTLVRAKSRTVVASYLFHLGYNGWLFVAFLAGTHFLKNLPQ
jgi:membrane protease YdiL (CAAX protease family)